MMHNVGLTLYSCDGLHELRPDHSYVSLVVAAVIETRVLVHSKSPCSLLGLFSIKVDRLVLFSSSSLRSSIK